MKVTFAIDPGKHNIGLAEFRDGVLYNAHLEPTKDFIEERLNKLGFYPIDVYKGNWTYEVVVEKMQVYRGSVAAPLIELAIISSEIAGAMRYVYGSTSVYYRPAEWKGSATKDVIHDRARAALTPEEISRIELPRAKKTQLDVWDAVSLGLAHLRKTGVRVGRSFAR